MFTCWCYITCRRGNIKPRCQDTDHSLAPSNISSVRVRRMRPLREPPAAWSDFYTLYKSKCRETYQAQHERAGKLRTFIVPCCVPGTLANRTTDATIEYLRSSNTANPKQSSFLRTSDIFLGRACFARGSLRCQSTKLGAAQDKKGYQERGRRAVSPQRRRNFPG